MRNIDTDRSTFSRSTRPHWLQMLAEGIILAILGWLAFFLSIFAPASPLARYINGAAIPVDGGAVRRV